LAAVTFGEGSFGDIQTQVGFAGVPIEAVAFEAAVREQRPDIEIEIEGLGRSRDRQLQSQQEEG